MADRQESVQLLEAAPEGISWREWGEEAFSEARSKRQPVLLDITATWCHWCHVMDETTYGNAEVVEMINSDYVAVRVDNDLRPDINARYTMGGWPTTAFLSPSGDILGDGTYMNAVQMRDALVKVASFYRTHQMEIASAALEARKSSGRGVARSQGELRVGLVEEVLGGVVAAYDPEFGGFGTEPKFPLAEALIFLLEQGQLRRDERLKTLARDSLEQMAKRGLQDQVEGGFFRYSTTRDWSVPHYEKMLEDQALLVMALARAGMDEELGKTVHYLEASLRNQDSHLYGGSQDADEEYYLLDLLDRKQRSAPKVDRRVVSAWNLQLAVAYLEAAAMTGREGLRERARGMMEELLAKYYKVGEGWEHAEGVKGQLADQAWGLLAAARACQWGLGEQWLAAAKAMAEEMEKGWGDHERGGYFDIQEEGLGRLSERMKPVGENAVAALALQEMEMLEAEGEGTYGDQARRALESVAAVAAKAGLLASGFARAMDRLGKTPRVSTRNVRLAEVAIREHPYSVIVPEGDERAVVCVGTRCLAPVADAAGLQEALAGIKQERE